MKKYGTRLRIILILEKLEGRKKSQGKAWQPIDRVEPPHLHRIRGQRGVLVHMEIPGVSINLQGPLLRLTGNHPWQTGGSPIGQVFTDCARDGVVQPIRLPWSGTGGISKNGLIKIIKV